MSGVSATPAADYPVPEAVAAHPAWFRLEGQRTYYSTRAASYQDTYKRIKIALIGVSASIPLLAFMPGEAGKWIVAAAGIAIAVLEAVLLLNQYGPLWVKYRGTAESLKRERWLLLARAGEYAGLGDDEALRLLAERVEALLDVEHREWIEEQKQALARLENARRWVEERRAQRDGADGAAAGAPGGTDAKAGAGAGAGDDTGAGAGTTTVGAGAVDGTLPADAVPSVSAASADEPAVAEPPLALPAPGGAPSTASPAVPR